MKTMMTTSYKLQKGFSLVTAIFLLVVLSGLGAMMVTFFTAQQQSSALDVLGSHAYQAARAGVEWAAYNVAEQTAGLPSIPGTRWPECATDTPTKTTTTFAAGTLGGTLSPFTVAVSCSSVSAVEGTTQIWIYDINASAVNGATPGSADYVERAIIVKMGR